MRSQIDENEELVLKFKVARIFFAEEEEEEEEEANIVVSIEDVTERRLAEDALRKNEEELQKRVHELEEFYNMAVGREMRMIELKEELEDLKEELEKYKRP